jgi:hypothetical protein
MNLHCPNCQSADLKKLSVADREGRFHVDTRTRLRSVVVGGVDRTWWSAEPPLAELSRRSSPSASALQRSGRIKSLFFGPQSCHSSHLSFTSVALCRVLRQRLRCPSNYMRSSRLLPSFAS